MLVLMCLVMLSFSHCFSSEVPSSVEMVADTRTSIPFTFSDQLSVRRDMFGGLDARTGLVKGTGRRKEQLQSLLAQLLEAEGWLPVRILAMAVSVGLELASEVIPVRGPTSNCHFAQTCLDLACGKCYDPMTSLHGDCGSLSFFRCTSLLPEACLPWTCAAGGNGKTAFLRNFLPRSAGCGSTSLTILTAENTSPPDNVQFTGLGLSMNSLSRCSEYPVCWDHRCNLCYDPLEQYHGICPSFLSLRRCDSLPSACQPILCWEKNVNETVQTESVIVRDFQDRDIQDIIC